MTTNKPDSHQTGTTLYIPFGYYGDPTIDKRLADMHRLHGKAEGKRCRTCTHCIQVNGRGVWHRCELSSGRGYWRVNWQACGEHKV